MATQNDSPVPPVARLGVNGVVLTPDMDFGTKLRILASRMAREPAAVLVNQDDAALVIAGLVAELQAAGLAGKAAKYVTQWNTSVDLLEANVSLPGRLLSLAHRIPPRGGTEGAGAASGGGSPFNFG
jgi:hypothetical protein